MTLLIIYDFDEMKHIYRAAIYNRFGITYHDLKSKDYYSEGTHMLFVIIKSLEHSAQATPVYP